MLSYALAIVVAISSLILFSTAFLMSKIHRKDDFLWSAVGLFYALILWFCARNITGTVLLGQAAATVLITSYCWQTIKLRKVIANPTPAVEKKNFSLINKINGLFKRRPKLESPPAPVVKPPTPKVTEQEIAIPETPVDAPQTSKTTVSPIDVAEKTVEPEAANSDYQTISDDLNNLGGASASQPLPNKLPEVVTSPQPQSPDEPKVATAETSDVPPAHQVEELVAEAAAGNPISQTLSASGTETATPSKDSVAPPQTESAPEAITPEKVESESDFDLLEVVEVAEVLEAEAENTAEREESDRDNIIEVTTTEINVVTETQKIEQTQADDADAREI